MQLGLLAKLWENMSGSWAVIHKGQVRPGVHRGNGSCGTGPPLFTDLKCRALHVLALGPGHLGHLAVYLKTPSSSQVVFLKPFSLAFMRGNIFYFISMFVRVHQSGKKKPEYFNKENLA